MDLKTLSLLEVIKDHKNLQAVLQQVEGDQTLFDASLCSPDFWFKMAEKAENRLWYEYVQHIELRDRRGDLKGGQAWYDYVKALDAGISYKLGVIKTFPEDGPIDGIIIPKVVSSYSIMQDYDDLNIVENDVILTFVVSGTRPNAGTKGILFHLTTEYNRTLHDTDYVSEIIIMDDLEKAKDVAKRAVCKLVSDIDGCRKHSSYSLRVAGHPDNLFICDGTKPTVECLLARWDDTRPFQDWTIGFHYYDDDDVILEFNSEHCHRIYLVEVEF